jgi:HSP20 family protein
MAIVRWEPARELSSLQSEMNRLFSTVFDTPTGAVGPAATRPWVPAMDLVETADHFVLKADLPGMTEQELSIEVEDQTLTISGERRSEHEEAGAGLRRVERAFGRFERSLTLPKGVDPEAVEAAFAHGVLEVRIPKPEEAKPRKIAIGVNGGGPGTLEA